jgi:hypothetical protein
MHDFLIYKCIFMLSMTRPLAPSGQSPAGGLYTFPLRGKAA